jgi:hypothetical protein
MPLYTSAAKRGYLSAEVQLRELRRRLAAGVPLEQAAQLMPVYVVGPADVAERAGIAPADAAQPPPDGAGSDNARA